jgi:hypothetical protein
MILPLSILALFSLREGKPAKSSWLAGLCPEYVCQRKGIENAEPPCQRIPEVEVDRVLSDVLLELVNPHALDVALTVQEEVQAQA